MTRTRIAAVGCGLIAAIGLCLAGVAVAAGNEAPLANAGLDQDVHENATVWLDATGSVDPDGEIETYEWVIETPDGATLHPDCRRCGQAEFRADAVGTYEATVTVTDDDGATSEDTLYVEVQPVETPDVDLSAPDAVTEGEPVNVTATIDAGDADLARVELTKNGSELNSSELGGASATETFEVVLDPGEHVLNATIVDRLGRTGTASTNVTVEARDDESGSTSSDGSDNGYSCDDPDLPDWHVGCEDKVYGGGPDGELILFDADGDGEVNVDSGYPDSEVTYETDTDPTDGTTTVDSSTHTDTGQKAFHSNEKSATEDLSDEEGSDDTWN